MAIKKTMVCKGEKYNRWTVIEVDILRKSNRFHLCECECGNKKEIYHANLVHGKSKSCGCLNKEVLSARKTHGKSRDRIYGVWNRMLSRCSNPIVDRYPQYGGRGIKVCDRWLKFENFYEDMGDIPSSDHSIGRKDNDGNYEPNNCKWETREEQANNTSRSLFIEHNGKVLTLTQWARELNINYGKLRSRYVSGMRPPKLFSSPDKDMHKKPVSAGGKTLLVTEWMKELDIPISTFYLKKRRGMTSEEIISSYL